MRPLRPRPRLVRRLPGAKVGALQQLRLDPALPLHAALPRLRLSAAQLEHPVRGRQRQRRRGAHAAAELLGGRRHNLVFFFKNIHFTQWTATLSLKQPWLNAITVEGMSTPG